jgi:hypothetical protein
MDKKTISEQLRTLATNDKNRTDTARLRDVIDDVEAALSAGVSRLAVYETLKENGLDMTKNSFDSALKRIRAKRGKGTDKRPTPERQRSIIPAQKEVLKPQDQEPKTPVPGSHDPAALDKIIGSNPDMESLAQIAKQMKKDGQL